MNYDSIQRTYQSLVTFLCFNFILRLLLEGYLDITIAAILNVQDVSLLILTLKCQWNTLSD
jgi:hypothetical protein